MPESRRSEKFKKQQQEKKARSKSAAPKKEKDEKLKRKSTFGGFFGMFKRNKKKKDTPDEEISRKESFIVIESVTTKDGKSLPSNFADKVLDLELKVDSGKFDIDTIDTLTQLYSSAVEFYSSKNDQRYKYFTERLQNMLVKPEILELMKAKDDKRRDSPVDGFGEGIVRERTGSVHRKNEEFERRKARAEKLKQADKAQQVKDPEII